MSTINLTGVFNLGNLAKKLASFIVPAYALGLNPLPALRKNFSAFTWRLLDDEDLNWSSLLEEIEKSHVVCAFPACDPEFPSRTIYLIGKSNDAGHEKSYCESYWAHQHGIWQVDNFNMADADRAADLAELKFEITELAH